jgi:hypothetical protein
MRVKEKILTTSMRSRLKIATPVKTRLKLKVKRNKMKEI